MTISPNYPPKGIYSKCAAHFDLTDAEPVFTYGETIYNPFNGRIDDYLYAHETTHMMQQGEDPETWWVNYITDPKFRFKQETQAYKVQYKVFCDLNKDRNKRARFLHQLAHDLASPMYGSMCSFMDAKRLISG